MAAFMEALKTEHECPIHLELLREPMILKCLHKLCKEDVEKMTDGGVVQCPTCNAVSDIDDVKHDFHAQKLLDILQAQEQAETSTSGKLVCGACNKADASAKCYTCDMYLDPDCALGHSRMKFSEPHRIETFVQIKKRNGGELREKAELLEERIERFNGVTASIEKLELEIQEKNTTTQKKLKKSYGHLTTLLAKKFAALSDLVERRKDENIAQCREMQVKLSASKQSTERELETVSNTIKGDDVIFLCDEYITELISQSACVIQSCDQALLDAGSMRPESKLVLPETECVVKQIKALAVTEICPTPEAALFKPPRVDETIESPIKQTRSGELSMSSLLDGPVTVTERFKFSKIVWNIQRVGAEIWAMLTKHKHDIIVLMPRDGNFVESRTIRIHQQPNMSLRLLSAFVKVPDSGCGYALGAVKLSRFGIIGSCWYQNNEETRPDNVPHWSDFGLVVLDHNGLVKTVIAKGPYHHIDTVNDTVCGLRFRDTKDYAGSTISKDTNSVLTLHTPQRDGWVQLREIRYDKIFDTVFATHHCLFFTSCYRDSCIFKKKLNDERHSETLVVPYTNTSGTCQLNINYIDVQGSILVSDLVNNKLVVFQAGNPPQARLVETTRELNAPGIGFEVNNEVIILERGSNRIISLKA